MKYLELKEQLLNEINMSPGALRRAAADIGARAGMEFEMIVPGAAQEDEDYEQEADYDSDESISSIQDAYDFFDGSEYNTRRDVKRLSDKMQEDYQSWLMESFNDDWDSDEDTFIYNYLKENANNDEIAMILGREDDSEDIKDNYGRKEISEAVSKIIERGSGMTVGGERWYDQAYESAYEDYLYEDKETEWLKSQDINTMRDVESKYDIRWPHYYNGNSGGGESVEDIGDSFSRSIGRAVEASGSYHNSRVTRPDADNLHYVVEPDSSLKTDIAGDGGLEFVSPALPIDELLDDLKKVKAWADKTGCYTNKSTGLHINVSVPAWQGDLSKLDYVKLAVLMGDEYVLQQFGRSGNTYANSALEIVRNNISQRPEDVKALLDQMKKHLNTSAAKFIHSGSTAKFTSVNTKDGYIEFRSPGGDWLNSNFDKIEKTLLRFVVAMDAAVDETKYKEEYAKKLYELLDPQGGKSKGTSGKGFKDTIGYFVNYATGELPQSALKSFIKQAQLERNNVKNAYKELAPNSYTAIPSSGTQKYEVQRAANDEIVVSFNANSDTDANAVARQWLADNGLKRIDFRLKRATGQERAEAQSTASTPADSVGRQDNYKIVRRADDSIVHTFQAGGTMQASMRYDQWLEQMGGDRRGYAVVPINQSTSAQGSTADLQQQRAVGGFTGSWKVMINDREVYRFGGVGNVQSGANIVAAQWARNNGYERQLQAGEVEVLPIMG
jgi:hypothetical protein